uniref:Uncharacterized protein n=1 Tax=Haptolina ericina TaxID=156174 RepID=A0A7S3EXH7_9EUKA|mmetsp:Transcript_2979/g.6377  ORF Transcript_2979/g.6377 Transcript_2979/m.6377 type:complete len:201 (+) Transcript_2979:217-819(+)
MIRNPIKRWVSLHDFHVSNQWTDLIPLAKNGKRKLTDAAECIRLHGASNGMCTGAPHDGNFSFSLFSTVAEREACNVSDVFRRYPILLTVEHSDQELPLFLRFLFNDTAKEKKWAAKLEEGMKAVPVPTIPSRYKKTELPEDIEATLAKTMQCDLAIYEQHFGRNAELMRAYTQQRRRNRDRDPTPRLRLPMVAPINGQG